MPMTIQRFGKAMALASALLVCYVLSEKLASVLATVFDRTRRQGRAECECDATWEEPPQSPCRRRPFPDESSCLYESDRDHSNAPSLRVNGSCNHDVRVVETTDDGVSEVSPHTDIDIILTPTTAPSRSTNLTMSSPQGGTQRLSGILTELEASFSTRAAGCVNASRPEQALVPFKAIRLDPFGDEARVHLPHGQPWGEFYEDDMEPTILRPCESAEVGVVEDVREGEVTGEPRVGEEGWWEDDRNNELLLQLRLNRLNIVIDSIAPTLAPHIVITPPNYQWDDYFVPLHNRTEPQWPGYLTAILPPRIFEHQIPPLDSQRGPPPQYPSLVGASENTNEAERQHAACSVYSRSRHLQWVAAGFAERLMFKDVVDAVFKHQIRVVAREASQCAPAFCSRSRASILAPGYEKAYIWSDPAKPILLSLRRYIGITVLESDAPFAAPHLVITEPPPQNPWVTWESTTNSQDDHFLSVYAIPSLIFEEVEQSADVDASDSDSAQASSDPVDYSSSENGSPVFWDGQSDGYETISSESEDSQDESALGTPPSWGAGASAGWLKPLDPPDADTWEHRGLDGCPADPPRMWDDAAELGAPTGRCTASAAAAGCAPTHCARAFDLEDDDEELPPFDDWYQAIAVRSNVLAS